MTSIFPHHLWFPSSRSLHGPKWLPESSHHVCVPGSMKRRGRGKMCQLSSWVRALYIVFTHIQDQCTLVQVVPWTRKPFISSSSWICIFISKCFLADGSEVSCNKSSILGSFSDSILRNGSFPNSHEGSVWITDGSASNTLPALCQHLITLSYWKPRNVVFSRASLTKIKISVLRRKEENIAGSLPQYLSLGARLLESQIIGQLGWNAGFE